MINVFMKTNKNESTIKKLHEYFVQRHTTERDVVTLSRNSSIVRKLASEVESL
jgi:hypothetical protein